MHSFDLATEAETRDALNGHWFQHYTELVSALRGWSDSDTFMAPYVGNPLEGSIFGYIERQNDSGDILTRDDLPTPAEAAAVMT